jgi:branched-chain amino acid transport system substrate-binding protein
VGGKAANDVYYSTHAFMAPTGSTDAIAKFYADYKAAYGTEPENAFAALGYDTLGLIADAIKRAGSEDPAKIRDALAATKGYPGITGSITIRRQPCREDSNDDRRKERPSTLGRSDVELVTPP